MNFIDIVDIIFKNKNQYHNISDEDKCNNFYIINKKFYLGNQKIASFFNNIYIDKASAMDLWFLYFKNIKNIPKWYWISKSSNKNVEDKNESHKIKKYKEAIKNMYNNDIKDEDVNFLIKYYSDDIDNFLKNNK